MPTYDYLCSSCEHRFEKICRIDDRQEPEKNPCPSCGKENAVSITMTAPSLVSPFRVEGLVKPNGDFRDRMQQIKKLSGRKNNIKDY